MTTKQKNILIYTSIGLVVVGIYLNSKKTVLKPSNNPAPNKNKDGSDKKIIKKDSGIEVTIVDAAGDYIENSDNSTLYNANGDVIGNINPSYGMFVDSFGNIIAASDGTPVKFDVSSSTYTEPDGTIYKLDGSVVKASSPETHWWDIFVHV